MHKLCIVNIKDTSILKICLHLTRKVCLSILISNELPLYPQGNNKQAARDAKHSTLFKTE